MNATRMRVISVVIWVIAIAASAILLRVYFTFVGDHIYDDSSSHLSEVYAQVDNNFNSFLNDNWQNLEGWYELVDTEDTERARQLIETRKELWGFTDFLFLDDHDEYMTIEGQFGAIEHGQEHVRLFQNNENVMDGQSLPDGTHFTLLAIPVPETTFEGFTYRALALSFSNEDIAKSLDTDAFDGTSTCFILQPDGKVVLSTQEGGTVFANYLSYLHAASNLTEGEVASMQAEWANGIANVVRCTIGGEEYYLSYEPVGYEDFILLGVVPESAASGALREIQEATVDVALKVALLLGAAIVIQVVLRYRKQSRQNMLDLRNRDRMFSMLSANVDDISLMLDGRTWKVDYITPNVERLLGIPAEEVQKDISVLDACNIGGHTLLPFSIMMKVKDGESMILDTEQMNVATGERHWYHEVIYRDGTYGNDKFFIVMSDRTDERRMNERLEDALETAKDANRAKSDFLSNMSHDIRTPMNSILGFTELLDINAADEAKVHEYVKKISSSGNHLLGLINDVLDMSKIESGKTDLTLAAFSPQQLVEDVSDIIGPQAKAKSQTFDVSCDVPDSVQVMGDKLRVSQILLNLLSNAVKYTPEGGHVEFTITKAESDSKRYRNLVFTVSDNGYGMDAEFLETLFDPFTREERSTINAIQGTGLGMAITKNLVDLMGGIINVKSTLGEGTTFTVQLPFAIAKGSEMDDAADESEGAVAKDAVPEDALRGLHILMAEDNEMSAEMLTERLDIEGATVDRAHNGQEAVDMFIAAEPGTYDIVLMDVEMPVMGGHDATRAIRSSEHADAADIPIFAMTANVFVEDIQKALDAGMNAHLAKPIELDKLKLNAAKYVRGTD